MGKFLMPSLGSDMQAGVLVEWEKKPGDEVRHGDVVAVVETDKGAIEIEAYETGVLESILVEVGEKVPVGTPLAMIKDSQGAVKESARQNGVEQVISHSQNMSTNTTITDDRLDESIHVGTPADSRPTVSPPRIRVTPAARALAVKLNIDLSSLSASGSDGAICLADVRHSTHLKANGDTSVAKTGSLGKTVARADIDNNQRVATVNSSKTDSRMRDSIAAAMSRSKREIPHYYLIHSIDLSAAEGYIKEVNASREPEDRLLIGALLIKAVATAVDRYQEFNGFYNQDAYFPSEATHIGMAINTRGGGLVAPAIHHADQLTLDETMQKLRDLVGRVREGRFRASELSDPTLTITSLGERGVQTLIGVVYPPQVAIVGFGKSIQEPVVKDGEIVIAPMMSVSLAADHRVSDGHRGALFLNAIDRHLQMPGKL